MGDNNWVSVFRSKGKRLQIKSDERETASIQVSSNASSHALYSQCTQINYIPQYFQVEIKASRSEVVEVQIWSN